MQLLKQSLVSTVNFFKLILSSQLYLRRDHLREKYKVDNGKSYLVFRDTVSNKDYPGKEVTLVVGFRLLIIGSNPFFHWLFQCLSILDTPVWVGFPGFKEKFWMVDPKTKDYLGIYRYKGKENSELYAKYITSILRKVSTKGSVWYEISDEKFFTYVKSRK